MTDKEFAKFTAVCEGVPEAFAMVKDAEPPPLCHKTHSHAIAGHGLAMVRSLLWLLVAALWISAAQARNGQIRWGNG